MIEPELEIAVLTRYVRAAKRERCVGFVSKSKTRDKVFAELRSPAIFDPAFVTKITGGMRSPVGLLEEYREWGMGPEVYVMSTRSEWDGRRMPLAEALRQTLGAGSDVLAYCPASGTAFYEWHHSGASWFLSEKAPR